MTLAPLLNAPLAIQIHAGAALSALLLGIVQLTAPKGTLPHRTIGYLWVTLMGAVALSSLWIYEIRLMGPWSPIHFISLYVLASLPLAIWSARRHNVTAHRRHMLGMFLGGLIGAGLFTLLPGRIMGQALFGG